MQIFFAGTRHTLRPVVRAAGVRWTPNCHRHSFVSYTLELLGARETARLANHSEATLWANYANKVARAEAEEFAALRPECQSATSR